jgi:hypothetical protein
MKKYRVININKTEYITNPKPNATDPYNTPYESVNWSEIYQYYPPNGIQYINPYQRQFPSTNTTLLKNPYVSRVTGTPFNVFSLPK